MAPPRDDAATAVTVARAVVKEPGVCQHQLRLPAQRAENLQWDLDPTPLLTLRMPDPAECEPRRTPRNPKWMPGRRDRRDAGGRRQVTGPGDWGVPRIVTAWDAGAVRIGMNWRKAFRTSASFSWKVGRTMYFEGPHEPASYRLLEIGHRTTDFQFQPLVVQWVRDGRVRREYFVDSVEERDTGFLVFRENKAHRAYFDDPEIDEKLSAAEAVLTRHANVGFERQEGTDLMHPLRWRIAKNVFDDRRVAYSERQRDDVRDLMVREGSPVPLGRIWETIGGPPCDAKRIANAMLVARQIGFDVHRQPASHTAVVVPRPPAVPGRLRQFLAQFAQERVL